MVIDNKHKFIFIELPLTATSAISKEIREMYGSQPFLNKHATYRQFLRSASSEQREYRSIGSIRMPLDQAVSMYFKYKNDKELGERFSTGKNKFRRRNGKFLRQLLSVNRHKKRSRYVSRTNADFEQYFLRFYKWPYSNWSVLDHKRFNYIIRFENLAADYKKVFTEIGVPIERDLPQANKTPGKKKDFWSYYETDKAKKRAKFVFGPFMRYWGYEFPESWNYIREPWYAQLLFNITNIPNKFYWRYLM
jgi:hypothetical protein